ncbi:uncharacterized protein LOC128951363 [Oppia nitens]|uniref:uncharacterized protein LOC128951363 n=1 Tax=Oppia nitens TaxID=1686743 RepID=UPI0023DA1753|nr:uncharacterized protein LOC128951363 [Oppia nitens]
MVFSKLIRQITKQLLPINTRTVNISVGAVRMAATSYQSFSSSQHVYRMSLNTCQSLYDRKHIDDYYSDAEEDYQQKNRNKWYIRFAPETGVKVNVEYVDTNPDAAADCPTIVVMHGFPGSYRDFDRLIKHFGGDDDNGKQNVRLIVPNFPNFEDTDRLNYFWHSSEERSQYLKDLLRQLNVRQIDCLVCHSASVSTAAYFWSSITEPIDSLKINSVCLLATPGPKVATKLGHVFTGTVTNLMRVPSIRRFFRSRWSASLPTSVRRLLPYIGVSSKLDFDDFALLMTVYYLFDTEGTVVQRIRHLADKQIPTVAVFGLADRYHKKEIYDNILDILGATEDNIVVYDSDDDNNKDTVTIRPIGDNDDHRWLRVIKIKGAGHYPFNTHHKLIHQFIEQLIAK